jgi:hypothetical protein
MGPVDIPVWNNGIWLLVKFGFSLGYNRLVQINPNIS